MTDWGYRAASALARRLPLGMSGTIADALADAYVVTHPRTAAAVARRLELDGADSGRTPRATYRSFARALLDFLRARDLGPGESARLDEETSRILQRARAEARATLLVSGHFGPWESALAWMAREVGSLDALAAPHRSRAVERFFSLRRAAAGIRTLSQGRPAAAALARLRDGGWIAALADRGCRERRRVEGLPGVVPIDRAPLLLARRARARVLAGVSWRERDGALHVRFLEPFVLSPARGGISLSQGAERLQRFFDDHVRAHPNQWYEWGEAPARRGAGHPEAAEAAGGAGA